MLKRNFCLLSLSCALTFPATAHEFNFGTGALSINMFSQVSFSDNSVPEPNDFQWSATGNTITGELYAGYTYNFKEKFNIGAEVFYIFGGPEVEQWVLIDRYITHSLKNAIGIRIVPGFNITPSTRAIAEVGYLLMKQDISVKDLDPTFATEFPSSSESETTGMLVYGIGLETMFYSSVGLRASFYFAPEMGSTDVSISTNPGTSTGLTYTANPVFNFFYLGGIYRFGF